MEEILPFQQSLVEHVSFGRRGGELAKMGEILDGMPEVARMAQRDVMRGLTKAGINRLCFSGEQTLRALLVKMLAGVSIRDLVVLLHDSRHYRAFCKIGIADKVPGKTALGEAIKKIQSQTLEAAQTALIGLAVTENIETGKVVRSDCTVMESNIHSPSDSSLLSDGVRVLCRTMACAQKLFGISSVDRRRGAKHQALRILNAKTDETRKKQYHVLVETTEQVVAAAWRCKQALDDPSRTTNDRLVALGLSAAIAHYTPLVEQVIDQTRRRVFAGEKVPVADKIVSLFEEHTDIIVKKRRETCYGHKLLLSTGKSGLITDLIVLDRNPADATLATGVIDRHKKVFGHVPKKVAFDGGFASKDNLKKIKKMGVADVAFAKKRGLAVEDMAKSKWVYKTLTRFRAGIEATISYLKRCFGLRRCIFKGRRSFTCYAWAAVLAANLTMLARKLATA